MNKLSLAFLFIMLFLVNSCGEKSGGHGELQVVSGDWGHLDRNSMATDLLPNKMFLHNLKPEETYNICLSKEMSETIPGVEEEIKAAINIWGHYIGRVIDVNISVKEMPYQFTRPEVEGEADLIIDKLYPHCDEGTDLLISLIPMEWPKMGEKYKISTLGFTTTRWLQYQPNKDGKRQTTKEKRVLFLRKSLAFDKEQIKWVSTQNLLGKELQEEDLLQMMVARKTKSYLAEENVHSSLSVLTHEFGHAWGICDMYRISDARPTNCDAKNSLLKEDNVILLVDDSIMGKNDWTRKLYLREDDIKGIRAIAQRFNVEEKWPLEGNYSLIPIEKEQEDEPLEHVSIRDVVVTPTKITTVLSIVSHAPLQFSITLYEGDKAKFPVTFTESKPANYGTYSLNTNLWGPEAKYTKLKLEVQMKTDGGTNVKTLKTLERDLL